MGTLYQPRDDYEVREVILQAGAARIPLELYGQGSKRDFGRPLQPAAWLDLSGLTGMTLYEPDELVLTAKAGTPMAEIVAAVAAKGQMLAFEPPDWGPLWGGVAGRGTLGGALACNLAGPRRFKAGAARDHFLGLECVTGRGEIVKAGGRVVKNVTGYDLCKLLAGSFGTLAALTEVTIKVLPRPEVSQTLLLLGQSAEASLQTMVKVLQSTAEVSGAAWLPAALSPLPKAITALRLEGPAPSVVARLKQLTKLIDRQEGAEVLQDDADLWRTIRDGAPFAAQDGDLWRATLPSSSAAGVLKELGADAATLVDWGGGLLWWQEGPHTFGRATQMRLRAALQKAGGRATLLRASAARRAAESAFDPLAPNLLALNRRVKDAFDPLGLLNPGRLYPEL